MVSNSFDKYFQSSANDKAVILSHIVGMQGCINYGGKVILFSLLRP